MALGIDWSEEAEEQLGDIIEYLESKWTEKELKHFFTRLEESIQLISKSPQSFKKSDRKSGAHEFQLSPQTTIFYSYDSSVVNILLLWPNKNDPKELND